MPTFALAIGLVSITVISKELIAVVDPSGFWVTIAINIQT